MPSEGEVVETDKYGPIEPLTGARYKSAGVDGGLPRFRSATPDHVHNRGCLALRHPVEGQLRCVRSASLAACRRRVGIEADWISQIRTASHRELQFEIAPPGNKSSSSSRHPETLVVQHLHRELGRPLVAVSAERETIGSWIVVMSLRHPVTLTATTHKGADQVVFKLDIRSDHHAAIIAIHRV